MSAGQDFAVAFGQMMDRCRDQQKLVARLVMLDVASEMIQRSPVDTGRFKNNWFAGLGAKNLTTTNAVSKSGTGSQARIHASLEAFEIGHKVYITNSLPYAVPLEHGHSKQAPNGMVGMALQNYTIRLRQRLGQLR